MTDKMTPAVNAVTGARDIGAEITAVTALAHRVCVGCTLARPGYCAPSCHPGTGCQEAYFVSHARCRLCRFDGDGTCHERECHPGMICALPEPAVPVSNPMFEGMTRHTPRDGLSALQDLHGEYHDATGSGFCGLPWRDCPGFVMMHANGICHTVYVVWDGDFCARIVDVTDEGPVAALAVDISGAWENAGDAMAEAAEKVIAEVRVA